MAKRTAARLPDQEILRAIRESVAYEPATGRLIWLRPAGRWGHIPVGSEAGYMHNMGYRQVKIGGRKHLAHRIAWYLHYGEWPSKEIDHIDCNPLNNRIDNLRLATHAQNLANRARYVSGGLKGAYYRKNIGNWSSTIIINGKRKYLGVFDTAEEAHKAYMAAAADSEYKDFIRP